MGAGHRILADVVDATDAGLGDGDDVVGDVPPEPGEDRSVDLEGAQVAGVDPDDGGAAVDGAAGLLLVVDLDERGHPERLGVLPQVDEVALVQGGDDEQDEVGAPGARLGELVPGDEEVLAQQGDVDPAADGGEVVEAAREPAGLGEDADDGGTARGVLRGERGRVGDVGQGALAGAGPLDLGDHRHAGL